MLDLTVDDQDHTHASPASGLAIGCIITESAPMRGCFAERLGRCATGKQAARGQCRIGGRLLFSAAGLAVALVSAGAA